MKVLKWLNSDIRNLISYKPGKPIEQVARDYGLKPEDISKLASNENPLGSSPKALRRVKACLKEMALYPDSGAYYLRKKLAEKNGLRMDNFILGNGSNEILELIGHSFMTLGRSVVMSKHSFLVYKMVSKMFGTDCIEVNVDGLGHDLNAMLRAIRPDTSVVFICNPNNPTGTLLRQNQIKHFMDHVPDDLLVVFDEAYYEICLARMPDTIQYVREGRNCIVLRTFSKAYGLAGFRIGYGMAPKPVIEAIQKARQPFNVSRIAQEAAMGALDDDGFVNRSRRIFRQGKAYIEGACQAMNWQFEPGFANFMLIKVGNAAIISEELLKRGVIVRPMGGYGLPEYIRLSYGTMEDNEKFVVALRKILKKR